MRVVVNARPVLYACQGCPEFGNRAREVGAALDSNGVAEMVWLGVPDLKRRSRFPTVALDGCAKGCALRWLERHGIAVEHSYVLDESTELAVARITADLG